MAAVTIPAINKPVSSRTPNLNAAVKPITDQINGMMSKFMELFLSLRSNIPNVKRVVGHGRPKVGEVGYTCPR
jgi:hypothetical protein